MSTTDQKRTEGKKNERRGQREKEKETRYLDGGADLLLPLGSHGGDLLGHFNFALAVLVVHALNLLLELPPEVLLERLPNPRVRRG